MTPIDKEIIGAIKGANITYLIITGAEFAKSPVVAKRVLKIIKVK